jgi:hypothetical protein
MYMVIRKSLWDFRPLRYKSQDGHTEGEYVNRGTDVLDMSTLGGIEHLKNVSRTR